MAGYGTILAKAIFDRWPGTSSTPIRRCCRPSPAGTRWPTPSSYGVKVTGCTVHVATEEVDAGPILAQAAVDVRPDDTVESLHERIKVVERRLYVQTIRDIVERGSV